MDEAFGLAVLQPVSATGEMSQPVREAVNQILRRELDLAVKQLEENRSLLDTLVEKLLEKNYLTEAALRQILTREK